MVLIRNQFKLKKNQIERFESISFIKFYLGFEPPVFEPFMKLIFLFLKSNHKKSTLNCKIDRT